MIKIHKKVSDFWTHYYSEKSQTKKNKPEDFNSKQNVLNYVLGIYLSYTNIFLINNLE